MISSYALSATGDPDYKYQFDQHGNQQLVYTAISQKTHLPSGFQLFKSSLKINRENIISVNSPSGGSIRGDVTELSQKSKTNLRFRCLNSRLPLISQFCMTYPSEFSNNGRLVQAHFNRFMTTLRAHFKKQDIDFIYLWVKEFQKRGAPHYHLFLSVPVSKSLHSYMARLWFNIAGRGDINHFRFHMRPVNFCQWDMGNGQYLTKYLEKNTQKLTPEEYENVGRFWGCSRGIVKVDRDIETTDLQLLFPDHEIKNIVRWVGKWHENKLKHIYLGMKKEGKKTKKIKSSIRHTSQSKHIFHAATIYKQIINYLLNLPDLAENPPF